jgi:hypothetical protein
MTIEPEPVPLAEALRSHPNPPQLTERLVRRFGWGSIPSKRAKLYARLETLVSAHGDRALSLVGLAAAEAVGRRFPDRYFCKAVVEKLRDAGLIPPRPTDLAGEI